MSDTFKITNEDFFKYCNFPAIKTAVLGNKGKLGSQIERVFCDLSNREKVVAYDIKSTFGGEYDPKIITQAISQDNPALLLLAISANKQVDQGVPIVKEWIRMTKSGRKIVVNLNSVQSVVKNAFAEALPDVVDQYKPVVLISLHQNHRPEDFDDLDGKVWILSDVTIFGLSDEEADQIRPQIIERVKDFVAELPKKYENSNYEAEVTLVDLTAGYTSEDLTLDGPEYHDYIAAYYQALFHMVKLLPNVQETEWYKDFFNHVRATDDLSQSIIEQNPFAKEVEQKFHDLVNKNYSLLSITIAISLLLRDAELIIHEDLRILKTKNVHILDSNVQIFEELDNS